MDNTPKCIFISSRYAGDIKHNEEVAEQLCKMAMELGYAPYAPHLIYPRFLDDNRQEDRERGITCGLAFLAVCDMVWVYTGEGISEGMEQEIQHANRLGKPVILLSKDCLENRNIDGIVYFCKTDEDQVEND